MAQGFNYSLHPSGQYIIQVGFYQDMVTPVLVLVNPKQQSDRHEITVMPPMVMRLEDGEVLIKRSLENDPIVQHLQKNNVMTDTGRRIPPYDHQIQVWRISAPQIMDTLLEAKKHSAMFMRKKIVEHALH